MGLLGRTGMIAVLITLSTVSGQVKAGSASTSVMLNITVIAGPCVINGDNPIDVDFGHELLTNKVDGNNYQKTVEYSMDCTKATNPALKMMISGAGAGFDNTVLQASQPSLGVKLLNDGQPMSLNQWVNFTAGSQPLLQAVPVKEPGGKLTAGDFTAAATMTVDYQ